MIFGVSTEKILIRSLQQSQIALGRQKMVPLGQPLLSEDWWRMAGVDYKSELASSCGCC